MFRAQYAKWKEGCRQLFPLVGSGKFITAPVISEDGQPIHDPLVLLETNPRNGVVIPVQDGIKSSSTGSANNLEKVTDKRVIQWMLTLHQIGLYIYIFFISALSIIIYYVYNFRHILSNIQEEPCYVSHFFINLLVLFLNILSMWMQTNAEN